MTGNVRGANCQGRMTPFVLVQISRGAGGSGAPHVEGPVVRCAPPNAASSCSARGIRAEASFSRASSVERLGGHGRAGAVTRRGRIDATVPMRPCRCSHASPGARTNAVASTRIKQGQCNDVSMRPYQRGRSIGRMGARSSRRIRFSQPDARAPRSAGGSAIRRKRRDGRRWRADFVGLDRRGSKRPRRTHRMDGRRGILDPSAFVGRTRAPSRRAYCALPRMCALDGTLASRTGPSRARPWACA